MNQGLSCSCLLVLLGFSGCAGVGEPPGDDGQPTDDTPAPQVPVCPGLDAPCDALPARPTSTACGSALRALDTGSTAPSFPDHLSELGCFVDGDLTRPEAGVVPYDVATPLWTQGAHKQRYLVVPDGEALTVPTAGPWSFPEGSLLLKVFAPERPGASGPVVVPVEVRVMLRAREGWRYASYAWDAEAGDGTLVGERGRSETLEVVVDGVSTTLDWWYPGLVGCETCHRGTAEEVLGPQTAQLNVDVHYGHVVANQLVALYAAGWLAERPPEPSTLPAMPRLDGPADTATKARAWLHANCAHCHQPGGFVSPNVDLDLRFGTPTAQMHACGAPRHAGHGLPGTELVVAGDRAASHLYARLVDDGYLRMPPDGAVVDDVAGIALVGAWIDGLTDCP